MEAEKENLVSQSHLNKALEKQLFRRFKMLGFVLMTFSVCSLLYAALSPPFEPLPIDSLITPEEMELSSGLSPLEPNPKEVLNFYVISGIFALIGVSCILYAWRRKE